MHHERQATDVGSVVAVKGDDRVVDVDMSDAVQASHDVTEVTSVADEVVWGSVLSGLKVMESVSSMWSSLFCFYLEMIGFVLIMISVVLVWVVVSPRSKFGLQVFSSESERVVCRVSGLVGKFSQIQLSTRFKFRSVMCIVCVSGFFIVCLSVFIPPFFFFFWSIFVFPCNFFLIFNLCFCICIVF